MGTSGCDVLLWADLPPKGLAVPCISATLPAVYRHSQRISGIRAASHRLKATRLR
jgi:hypothetical protein